MEKHARRHRPRDGQRYCGRGAATIIRPGVGEQREANQNATQKLDQSAVTAAQAILSHDQTAVSNDNAAISGSSSLISSDNAAVLADKSNISNDQATINTDNNALSVDQENINANCPTPPATCLTDENQKEADYSSSPGTRLAVERSGETERG